METADATAVLAALAQTTRLATFRRLVAREPHGMPAGDLAREAGIPPNTLSNHLAVLARAGLVRGTRLSRSINYRASIERLGELLDYLVNDCCDGRPEVCEPLGIVPPCCTPTGNRRTND